MNALVTSEASALAFADAELVEVLQGSLYPRAKSESIQLVLGYCRATGLDPMQKPVHIVPVWDSDAHEMRDIVLPGIGLYRTLAARSGCAGMNEPEFGPEVTEIFGSEHVTFPLWCRVTVKRRLSTGEIVDFTAKELWRENYSGDRRDDGSVWPNGMWTRRPYGQLAKCAEAQALRKAFPEIGAQPVAEEMEGKSIGREEPRPSTPSTPSRKPAVLMPEAVSKGQQLSDPVRSGIVEQPDRADDSKPATPGEIGYLMKTIQSKGMAVATARAVAGMPPGDTFDGLTKSGFEAIRRGLR